MVVVKEERMSEKHPSARCSRCPYTIRLRKDGLIMAHTLWAGNSPYTCDGSLKPPLQQEE